jgi:molybdopterin-guanine dinucleotide biosynthesis protein
MRPTIIGIGGAYSGVGKTTLASLILKRLKGWGAIKYTKTGLYCSVVDDIETLSEKGKDTKIFLDSGAEKVLWVQSPYDNLPESLNMALERLSHLKGIVIEGNSAIEVLKPDVVIFISGAGEGEFKKGAEKILNMSDIVILDKEPGFVIPEKAKTFYRDNVEECIKYILGFIRKRHG